MLKPQVHILPTFFSSLTLLLLFEGCDLIHDL